MKGDIGDVPFSDEQVVQEVYQQGLGELLSEDSLESYVCEWVDEFSHAIFVS